MTDTPSGTAEVVVVVLDDVVAVVDEVDVDELEEVVATDVVVVPGATDVVEDAVADPPHATSRAARTRTVRLITEPIPKPPASGVLTRLSSS